MYRIYVYTREPPSQWSVLFWAEAGSACSMPWRRLWVPEGGIAVCSHRCFFHPCFFFCLSLTAHCHIYLLRKLNYVFKHVKTDFWCLSSPPLLCMGKSFRSRSLWGSSGSKEEVKHFVSQLRPSDGRIQLSARQNCLSPAPLWGTQTTTCTRSYYLEQEPTFAQARYVMAMLFIHLFYFNVRGKGTPLIALHQIYALHTEI